MAFADLTQDLPSIEQLPVLLNPIDGQLLQPTSVYDRTGQHVLLTFGPGDSPRRYVPLTDANPQHLPKALADGVVAMADPAFWTHPGYTLNGLDQPEAHPTIAQRLAYDLLLFREAPSFRRALRERLLAAQITNRFGRTQILEWYLNAAHFGRSAYGAAAASELYFGKPVDAMTLSESALLAGVSEAPALNPQDASAVALQHGREVLLLLDELNLADHDEVQAALAEPMNILPAAQTELPVAAAFVNTALAQLETQIPRARLERGGLRIVTTLDYELQQQAACLTEVFASRLGAHPEPAGDCESALRLPALPPETMPDASASTLVLDSSTGQVLAMTGETREGRDTPLVSPHEPGSLLDAFVYLTGFTTGMGPGSPVWDVPPAGASAAEGLFEGPMRLRLALGSDVAAPVASVLQQVGEENAARTIRSFGLSPDEALSSLEVAGAFGALGTQGVYFGQTDGEHFTPVTVLRVEALDGAALVDWSVPEARSVVSQGLAYLITDALKDESARERALGRPNATEIGRPAAVKLGLSEDGTGAWAVGYTPMRVVVAWTGSRTTGLTRRVPAALYAGLMQHVSRELPADDWTMPPDVVQLTVCDPSGLLPTADCPQLVSEVFLLGSQPHQADTLYRKFVINRETGYLATVFTPPELVEERVYLMVPAEAAAWAVAEGLPLPPDAYDAIHAPDLDPDINIASPALFDQVDGTVRISGSAAGADFVAYRILAGAGINPEEWIEVASSETPVTNGLLGQWDTTGLNGLYTLQLAVTRTDDRLDTAVTQVTITE